MPRTTTGRVGRRAALAAGAAALVAGCAGRSGGGDRNRDCDAGLRGPVEGRDPDARLGLVGDVMLGRNVDRDRRDDPPGAVWGSVGDRLDGLDGVVANLECCLSARGEPTPGRTYHFRADPAWAVPALRAGNVAAVALANNHVLDFGRVAFADTLAALDDGGVAHAGAGPDVAAARTPATATVGGVEVAVVSLTDQAPAYAAGPTGPGTAFATLDARVPTTRALVRTALATARERADLVVVSLHWGPNWVAYPDRRYRRFARFLVDAGADLVHGHSAHVFQGIEVYRGRPILHDCGDFVDDYVVKPELRNDRSLLVEASVTDGRVTGLELVPVEIRDRAVHLADATAAEWIRRHVRERSAPFGTRFARPEHEREREREQDRARSGNENGGRGLLVHGSC